METLELLRLMSFVLITAASLVLLYFTAFNLRLVLGETYQYGLWMLSAAAGAGIVYGGAGYLQVSGGQPFAELFRQGATLFFILFLALGIRAIARMEPNPKGEERRNFIDYCFDVLVVGLFVSIWWSLFVLWQPAWFVVLHGAGWIAMVSFALYFSFQAVGNHEGTVLAAIVRDLLPAVFCFGMTIVMEIIYRTTGQWANLAEAAWIVGIVLVSAFLFNTATTIRQEEAELHRIYDPTTWREQ